MVKLNAEMVNPVAFRKPVCRDKDDDKFLAAALGGTVQYIATGDDDLLVLDGHQGLKIMKPKAFLNKIKLKSPGFLMISGIFEIRKLIAF